MGHFRKILETADDRPIVNARKYGFEGNGYLILRPVLVDLDQTPPSAKDKGVVEKGKLGKLQQKLISLSRTPGAIYSSREYLTPQGEERRVYITWR